MIYKSPLGPIRIKASAAGIQEVCFLEEDEVLTGSPGPEAGEVSTTVVNECVRQLDEYFAGKRIQFTVPYALEGSSFQKKVWAELQKVPFGKTLTYRSLAQRLGDVKAIRAVGSANGKNPLAILVPCHRIIGSDGSLTGYAGGLGRKKWLLTHENRFANGVTEMF